MEPSKIEDLLRRYRNGETTSDEDAWVESWYLSEGKQLPSFDKKIDYEAKGQKIWNQIQLNRQPKPPATYHLWTRLIVAASIVVLIGTGIFFYKQKQSIDNQNQISVNNIQPGGNKAFLTLANGQKISLTDATNGNIAEQAGVVITKTADGQLVYEVLQANDNANSDEYNTIETPSGGQYQVRLPDGTAVWLNAASSLKYPASFASKKERHVQLSGEAYFEVAKDNARPFIVVSHGQQVEVLGTHFNINAYDDESSIKTTLLEGSVKVGSLTEQNTRVIKPGEQAINMAGKMQVAQVNTNYAVAWKDGYFRFNDKTLEMGLREIARWYNVEVIFKEENLKNEPLAGRISKYDNIQQVLKKMELAGIVNFTVRGRQIIVK